MLGNAKLQFVVILTCLLFVSADVHAVQEEETNWINLSADYQTLSAAKKSDLLWSKIKESKYDEKQLPEWCTSASGVFQSLLNGSAELVSTFTCNFDNSDILKLNRVRPIHLLGVVGRVQWKMTDGVKQNNYTGLLANGALVPALIRFSLATPGGNLPGIAIKLLINGKESVNTVATFDADGQGADKNFFAKPFRTTLPAPKSLPAQLLTKRFDQIAPPAGSIPVRDFARFTVEGKTVEKPVYPFMLEFRPVPRIANLIASDSRKEFRLDLIEKLSPGSFLDVYAASALNDSKAFKTGEVLLESKVLASSFGDERLCFKHQRN